MGHLILEFDRANKIQEPEARFCYVFKNLRLFNHCEGPYLFLYQNVKGKLVAEYNSVLENMWLVHSELWSIFYDKYVRDNDAIQLVIKNLLKIHFNITSTPRPAHALKQKYVYLVTFS